MGLDGPGPRLSSALAGTHVCDLLTLSSLLPNHAMDTWPKSFSPLRPRSQPGRAVGAWPSHPTQRATS